MDRFILCIQILFSKKGVDTMVMVYVTAVFQGLKTFSQVPPTIKQRVKDMLIAMDLADLAE